MEVAQRIARQCIEAFDGTLARHQRLHHPLAIALLSPEYDARAHVQRLACGTPLHSLPAEIQILISALKFIPIAERVVEGKHKDVKRALSHLTRHSAPRVSMAVRHAEVTSVAQCPEKMTMLQQALAEVRSSNDLPAVFGLASHPDLQAPKARGRKRLSKEFVNVVYRCDLPAQYLDLQHATRLDAAIKKAEKTAVEKTKRQKGTTWNAVLAKSLASHLQSGGNISNGNGLHCYSLDLVAQVGWLPLSCVLDKKHAEECKSGPPLQALTLHATGCSESLPTLQGAVGSATAADDVRGAVGSATVAHQAHACNKSGRIFFTPLARKNYQKLHRVPHPAAVGQNLLPRDSLLCLPHSATCLEAVMPGVIAVVCTPVASEANASNVHVLSNLAASHLQTTQPLLEWERVPGKCFYTISNMYTDNPLKLHRLSNLLSKMFKFGAVLQEGPDGELDVQKLLQDMPGDEFCDICESDEDRQIFQDLQSLALVVPGPVHELGFDFVLLPAGSRRINFGSLLQNPVPVLQPCHGKPLSELSLVQCLLNLTDSGWLWQPLSLDELRCAPPYTAGSPRIFFLQE